jgi:hypothetical protein
MMHVILFSYQVFSFFIEPQRDINEFVDSVNTN